ncbi:hypothetical protein [Streptomyces sp. FL07-04A]|uniref:hypothetical protein n=1 Tax=Streptomyces sp. FL07-04A TaxID=3028658 RepID=UPI0029B7FF56|nr:hypothetical protein [Streptomyces sp. FL07-04A]MDX3579190.1 hypothetical protein [Streptomyces sp. FL07-04A]
MLSADENIVASCAEAGYYTYATSRSAANRMFADDVPLKELRQQAVTGSAPGDLTLIHGRSLALFDQVRGTGPSSGELYSSDLRRTAVTHAEIDFVKAIARSEALAFLKSQTSAIASSDRLEETEKSLMAGCEHSAFHVLQKDGRARWEAPSSPA